MQSIDVHALADRIVILIWTSWDAPPYVYMCNSRIGMVCLRNEDGVAGRLALSVLATADVLKSWGMIKALDSTSKLCKKNCGKGGICLYSNDTEVCVCNSGYVFRNETCIDKCSAGKVTKDICPRKCIPDVQYGYVCNCTGKYRTSKDNITCEIINMCNSGEAGYKNCLTQNALCINSENEDGYKCKCPVGTDRQKEEDKCQDLCTFYNNHDECQKKFAKCEITNFNKKTVSCVCPNSMRKNSDDNCEFATNSYYTTIDVYNKYELSIFQSISARSMTEQFSRSVIVFPYLRNIIDYPKLQEDLKESMKRLYHQSLQGVNVFNCSDNHNLKCEVEIQLEKKIEDFNKEFTKKSSCEDVAGNPEYCVFPPRLIVSRTSQTEAKFYEKDLCEDSKLNTCDELTNCEWKPPGYSCNCKSGYKSLKREPVSSGDKYIKDLCADINECQTEKPCHPTSLCINTEGHYLCTCHKGYHPVNGTDNIETQGCEHICVNYDCGRHGTCTITQNNTPACLCHEGYQGINCQISTKDINKCQTENPCHPTSLCINTEDHYLCVCDKGYHPVNDTDNIEMHGCQHICENYDCSRHGICTITQNNTAACVCHEGYQGINCQILTKRHSNTSTIVVGVVLGILLLFTSLALIILLSRRRKKTMPNSDPPEWPMVQHTETPIENRIAETETIRIDSEEKSQRHPSPNLLPRPKIRPFRSGEENQGYKEYH